ncbi:GTP cyclohydrolase I FolE2 (plasmid) [Pseudoalteromonas lipolytica]|uniref:GTP cyclohydrolase FolE2 n=2 Tax=Pseudoalteromonas TaxID=53246 RepID=A0AAD0S3A8_9GAMM|nr:MULTISPECIES: GTP cyclohydrolase FolE2 [Pseudoalteromonas]AXV67307.1 GTP cyclohydrolase I FolE2 [Pseudoalteromonas donghaensis]QLJ10291.1 GTP cyclohydrolase I FolE2 [Pseudoalteromonas sp. JSTW]
MYLPDITSHSNSHFQFPLKWVGMEKIALPIKLELAGLNVALNAFADVFVSLDSNAKGIHMSRLYLMLNQMLAQQTLTQHRLAECMNHMLASQQGLSQGAKLVLHFDLPLLKPALLSDNAGYNAYPVVLTITQQAHLTVKLNVTIAYSSTCPCSAALSRQLLSEAVDTHFKEDSIDKHALLGWLASEESSIATPHSQRSYAYIDATFESEQLPDLSHFIQTCEHAIGTPVQTAVKREDEQAFAALNAENLLFCEDAARRLKACLEAMNGLADYQFKIEHQESLHAHNAVVYEAK